MSQNKLIKNEITKINLKQLESYKKMFNYIILKNIDNYTSNDELKTFLSSITINDIYFSFIIFSKYNSLFINYNNEINENYLFTINNRLNIKLIILWYIFLFNEICSKKLNYENGNKKIKQMNHNIFLIKQTNNLLYKLYLSGKLNVKEIFIFIYFYLFWIENYSTFYFINEKNKKIKNIYFFNFLFELINKLTHEIMKDINKENLEVLIKFMKDFENHEEINNEYNIIILLKFNFIQSFIQIFLNNNLMKANNLKTNFNKILINFYTHFVKFKFRLSNIFKIFLDNTRIAYEHLYNFEDNINKILRDLNIQNFQTLLLKNIIDSEDEVLINDEFPLLNDSFLFNGKDSVIAFKMNNFEFEKIFLFFSFNFNPNISKNNNCIIYPLIVFQKEIPKDSKNFIYQNLFILYLEKINKKENNSDLYSLCISQPLMKYSPLSNKDDKIIVHKNRNYYCCLFFEEENLKIYLYNDSINRNKIKGKQIKLNNIPKKNIIISLGCDSLLYNKEIREKDEKKNFFSGYLGPIIIVKDINPKASFDNYEKEFIEKILLLKEKYKDFIYSKNEKSYINHNRIDNIFDYSFNRNKIINENNSFFLLKKQLDNFKCLFYLVPNCFIYFYNKKNLNKKFHLPFVSKFCDERKDYLIKKINITLFKYNLSISFFIYDNVFNYICLQLEYFNQLAQYYLANKKIKKENFNDIFDNNPYLMKDIINCIKINLLIMGNRENEINLSKTYKQIFTTLFNLLKNINKIKPIINDIIGDLISLSDIYKCNIFTNFYNLRDILITQQKLNNEIEKGDTKNINKILSEDNIQLLKSNYNNNIKKNCSFFIGILEILLSKEFYLNKNIENENYYLMKLAFEKVSSIIDIKDYECLTFFSYQNLFNQVLSFTNLLQNVMSDYMPDLEVKKNRTFYNINEEKNVKTSKNKNVLVSYFKLLNIFFRNKAINVSTSKEYFQKLFRFILGNHRYDLPIVYNFLHLFFSFIEEKYKYFINYEEIMQLFDYLNEITQLKEDDIFSLKNIKEENKEKEEDNNFEYKKNNNFERDKEKIKSAIICIIFEIIFCQKEIPDAFENLLNYLKKNKISKYLFLLIKDEIDKYFILLFNEDKHSLLIKKNIKDISQKYNNLFKLLKYLFLSLLTNNIEYASIENTNKEKELLINIETQKLWYILSIINILSDISNKIEDNINKEKNKKENIYCIINFLKFLYDIILDNQLNILYTHDLFYATAENVFNHCYKLSLINSNILINLDYDKRMKKTIIELILDIYIEFTINIYLDNKKQFLFKNNNNNMKYFSMLTIQNCIIYKIKNKKLKEKNHFNYNEFTSIFFINDYLKLSFTNTKYIKDDLFYFNINNKIDEIKEINNILKKQNKFDLIFILFFLIKIGVYKHEITKRKKNENNEKGDLIKKSNQLSNLFEDIQKIIIDDYKKLYIINKEYCSKSNSENSAYNIVKNIIETKIKNETKKLIDDIIFKEIINDLDLFIKNLTEDDYNSIKSGLFFSNTNSNRTNSKRGSKHFSVEDFNLNNILSNSDLINNENSKFSIQDKTYSHNLLNYYLIDKKHNDNLNDINKDKESDNIFNFIDKDSSYIYRVVPLDNIDNIICFFEQYDEMYLKNPKKELMNTIFAFCFKESFYYNNTFKLIKNYYLNNFEAENSTKKLNYPSKLKHFNNGLEPPLFLKYNKSFYISKVFPITHEYFYKYMIKNKILNDSIILFDKDLPILNIIKSNKNEKINFDYNCELILIDHSFYGHLINYNNNYLIFEEKNFELYKREPQNNLAFYSDLLSICSIIKKPKKYNKELINENQRNQDTKIVERRIKKKLIILYSEIEQIIERRFLLMWQGIEIFLKNGKSYFFNILDDSKCQKILEVFKNNIVLSKKLITKDKFERDINFIQNEWINNRIDTYEYLLLINKYSTRTYNDANQYLVFPWLLKDYKKLNEINDNKYEILKYINQMLGFNLEIEENEIKEKENNIEIDIKSLDNKENLRDFQKVKNKKIIKYSKIGYDLYKYLRELKYPVCAQTEKNRGIAMKRYIEDCLFNFKYHSGTHYSTSAYIYFYLMRNEPFSTLLVKLQNYSQENPNRMFNGIQDTIITLDSGNDNRELIPEFFSKIEFFINLNCVYFGKRASNFLVDDAYIDKAHINPSCNLISDKIDFLIEHKKLLNSESISLFICDWIDNIFGVNQLPKEEDRPLSCNIYSKSSYEQKTNLKNKLNKYLSPNYEKRKLTPLELIKKITDKINMIICFGQTPYQLFNEAHPKRKEKELKNIKKVNEEKEIKNKNKKKILAENEGEDFLLGDDDVQSLIINFIRPEKTNSNIELQGIYFEINPFINKVFILSKKRELLILNSKLYDRRGENFFNVFQEQKIDLPYIKFFGKINNEYINNFYILKQKYCFSSFIKEENYTIKSDYFYYFNKYVNNLLQINDKLNKDKIEINELNYYKLITCRHLDNTFKIILFPSNTKEIFQGKREKNKEIKIIENMNKIFSFYCEDFVTSCCAFSNDSFLIGLKNGKLVKGKVIENDYYENEFDKIEISINYEQYIQGHIGSINVIEVDYRLGIIITGGEDNYIYIRKLYDLELLTPIKIKDKYLITMAKISPMNLLYVICLNKLNNHSIIFGYTLSGIQFAKSEYGYFTNIDFTKSGNIVSLINKMDIGILLGSNLRRIQIKDNDEDCKEFINQQKKVDNALWMQYDYFNRKNANTQCRIISYISKDHSFNTINVDNIKYFE